MGSSSIAQNKTEVEGVVFASAFEAKVYKELKAREDAGEIQNLQCQVSYPLQYETPEVCLYVRELRGPKVRTYTPDFVFEEEGKTVVVEAKGRMLAHHSLRLSIFETLYPELELRVIRQGKRKKRKKKKTSQK